MPFSPLRPDDPRQVGPYRLTGQLGAGGMGIVYLARTRAGTPVALKLIRPEYAADPTFRARFRREVETAQRVHGVCIARFLDADAEAEQPYLVTEHVDGPSLGEVVAARGPFGGEQLQALAAGLAEGLVSLHRAGVVHRDLKPSNVLLASDAPKIIDFGIAHASDATSMTRTGHVVGSAGWMAPEQATGQRVTPAADVFAWASTLAYAATGRPPFGEGAPTAVVYRVVHQEPDLEGVPEALLPALRAAFAKDPVERPLPADLLALVTGAPATDPSDDVTRLLGVAWLPVAPLAGATTHLAVAAEPGTAELVDPADAAPADAAPADRSRRVLLLVVAGVLALLVGAGAAWAVGRDDPDGSPGPTTTVAPSVTTAPPATAAPPAPTATAPPTTPTTTPTTTPPDPGEAWAVVEAGLADGTASTGVLGGVDPPVAVTAEATDLTVWTWQGGAWGRTGSLALAAPVTGRDALTPARLTGAPADDVVVALEDKLGSVVAIAAGAPVLVAFDGPEGGSTTEVGRLRAGDGRVTGTLDDVDGTITWRYDPASGRFAVEDVDGKGASDGGSDGGRGGDDD